MTESVKQTIVKFQRAEAIYALISLCTKLPYVECDGETYDDQIFVYFKEEDAKKAEQKLIEKKIPVKYVKVAGKAVLAFFANLFPMGVNCVVVNRGAEGAIAVQLPELIKRPNINNLPDGKIIVENPELHLTAVYYIQELRRIPAHPQTEELRQLQEEMNSHFQKGRFIIAARELDNGIPVLKEKNGDLFHPVFTDMNEFQKFCALHKNEKFRTGIVEAKNMMKVLAPNARGIALNPMGVNVQLMVKKR